MAHQQKSKITARSAFASLALAASVATAGAFGFAALADAQPSASSFRAADCYRPFSDRGQRIPNLDTLNPSLSADAEYLARVVSDCGGATEREGISYANYYAAQAHRILGEAALPPISTGADVPFAAREHFEQADRLFKLVQLRQRPVIPSVELELARLDRLRRNFPEANARLQALTSRLGVSDPALQFERAMVVLDRDRLEQARQRTDMTDARQETLRRAVASLGVFATGAGTGPVDAYTRLRGPQELANMSLQIADSLMAMPTPESLDAQLQITQNARQYYVITQLANTALVQAGGASTANARRIQVNLGTLDLRLAGLLAPSPVAEFSCTANADVGSLEAAGTWFTQATEGGSSDPDAYWGLGCVQLSRALIAGARGFNSERAFRDAIGSFRSAIGNLTGSHPNAYRFYLSLAEALDAVNEWDDRNVTLPAPAGGQARTVLVTGALTNYMYALNVGGPQVSHIHMIMARNYLSKGQVENALCSLGQVIGAPLSTRHTIPYPPDPRVVVACSPTPAPGVTPNPPPQTLTFVEYSLVPAATGSASVDQAEAYLMRGWILQGLGDFTNARLNLAAAAANENQIQTQAYVMRSQLETTLEMRQRRSNFNVARGQAASAPSQNLTARQRQDISAIAVSQSGLAWGRTQDPDHRRQACIARIVFDQTTDGGAFCAPDDRPENASESQLYFGMFNLREGARRGRRGALQQNDWSRAQLAFDHGLTNLGASNPQLQLDGRNYNLRELLTFGRRLVLFCAGIGAADTSEAPVGALEFFAMHGVEGC